MFPKIINCKKIKLTTLAQRIEKNYVICKAPHKYEINPCSLFIFCFVSTCNKMQKASALRHKIYNYHSTITNPSQKDTSESILCSYYRQLL